MATGSLTSMVLTAGASMLANGSDPTLGGKPIASNSGVTLNVVDSTTGLTGNPTLYSMNNYTLQIQNIQSVLYDVTTKIANMANATLYINEFSTMTSGLGDEVFSAPLDLYSGNAYTVMHTANSIDSVLTFGRTESASVLGGAINGTEIEGNPKKFATVISSSIGFVQSSNEYINAANNSANAFTGGTFPGIDSVSSGALSGVNYAGDAMGNDFALLGTTINFSAIVNLGSPGQLLNNMLKAGTLGPMYAALSNIVLSPRLAETLGVTANSFNVSGEFAGGDGEFGSLRLQRQLQTVSAMREASGAIQKGGTAYRSDARLINVAVAVLDGDANAVVRSIPPTNVRLGSIGVNLNSIAATGAKLPSGIQEQIYIAFAKLTPANVSEVKAILRCTQPAVVNGSDFFDPTKLFATSFSTLTAPISANGISSRAIYINSTGSVNPVFDKLGDRLRGIIPENLAMANGALARSLGQIKGIESSGVVAFTNAATNLETMKGLPDIQGLTTYIPAGVAEYWQNYYGAESNIQLATGPGDIFTVADCIGYAAGFNSAAPLQQNYELLSAMNLDMFYNDDGAASSSTGVLVVLEYLIDGTYAVGAEWIIPAGVYAAGTYATFDTAYTAVIDATKTLMQSVYANNPTAQTIQANFKRMQEQQAREKLLRVKMDLNLTDIQPSESNAISLSSSIPLYALDTTAGGVSEYVERIVNINSLGGQATIAAMRESRNIRKLDEAKIQQDGVLDTTPPSNPGSMSNSEYTVAEASAIIVK